MRKPGESVYCLSFWRNKFHGKSGDEPYFDVVEDGISDTILWINVLCPNESEFHWAVEEAKKTAELKAKNLAPSELYAPFNNVQYRHREAAESDIDAFLRRNGVTPATAENDGTYGRKIYGPVPDDIKALLKKIGLGASECGNTLGELFQRWGVQ